MHGTFPDVSGKGIANPTAQILCAKMMLSYIGEQQVTDKIRRGVEAVLRKGKHITPDIGGTATTM